MTEQPLPVNKVVLVADNLMDFLVTNVIEPAVLAWLYGELPWLALPVIRNISSFFVDKLVEREAKILKLFLDFKIIDGQVASENQAVKDQLVAWNAAHAQGNADAIKKAQDDMAAAVSRLINFDGT